MKREQPAPERRAASPGWGMSAGGATPWTVRQGDPDFPPLLTSHPQSVKWRAIHGLGSREILKRKCLGLICSVQCPGSVVIKTFDAIRELRDAGIVIAGGFHSPMEQECLGFLLRGHQPVIVCPARHPTVGCLSDTARRALDAGRLLLVSPFHNNVRRTTKTNAQTRNEFVSALSEALLIPHASPGGKSQAVARQAIERGQPLFTFNDEENADLEQFGARSFGIATLRRLLMAGTDERI